MKFPVLFAVALTALYATGLHADDYSVKVGSFSKLSVIDNVNVVYRANPDSIGCAWFSGDKEFADAFIFTNKGGTLKIQVNTDDVNNPGLPTVYVSSEFLVEAKNSSIRELRVENLSPSVDFKAIQVGNGKVVVNGIKAQTVEGSLTTGNGTVVLSGQCETAKFRMVGTGTIQADALKAQDVKCQILGSGNIGCWPVQALSVRGIGSTKIYYKGDPKSVRKSGGGKLLRLDSADASEWDAASDPEPDNDSEPDPDD